ncbi:MAG: C39 family peptidase [Candidatus Spechtbacteria bacterium]|nr:C39 family peptidase [Candidatus Spechtbacteria bacterium]
MFELEKESKISLQEFVLQPRYAPSLEDGVVEVSSHLNNSTGTIVKKEESADEAMLSIEESVRDLVIFLNVPFTSQAPLENWDNVVYQQGCEEASILMAMLWVEGKQLTPASAEKAILAISNFEQENYGLFQDTSAADTAEIMRDYFHYENVEEVSNIGITDIQKELTKGNVVIVPVNGQKLGNPFYKLPGPIEHMLLIKGYDAKKKEFIVNDAGTKRGEGFRYKENVLEAALQDYPTGHKEPITEIKKAMIVVRPR